MQRHDHWLFIAQEDLESAKHLLVHELTTTLFHTQQCAEKALKGYLARTNKPIIKTHDLVKLVNLCLELNNKFEIIRPLAAELTPYEAAGRYPDNTFKKPPQEKIQELIEQSEYVFKFVLDEVQSLAK